MKMYCCFQQGGRSGNVFGEEDTNDKNLKLFITKLTELVKFLTNPQELNKLYKKQALNLDSEAWLIYLQNTLDMESDVFIFSIE